MRTKEEIEEARNLNEAAYAILIQQDPNNPSNRTQACLVDMLNWVLGNPSVFKDQLEWLRKGVI